MHTPSFGHWFDAERRLAYNRPPTDVPPPRVSGTPESGDAAPEQQGEVQPTQETGRRVEAAEKHLHSVSVDRTDPLVYTSNPQLSRLWWQNKPGATQRHYQVLHQAHLSWQANINRVRPQTPQQWEAFKASEVARLNPQLAPHGLRVFSYPGQPALGWEVINAGAAGIPDNLQGPLNDLTAPGINTGPNINSMNVSMSRLTILIAILIALAVMLKLAQEGMLGRDGRARDDRRPEGGGGDGGPQRPEAIRNPARERVREEMRSRRVTLDGLKQHKEKTIKANATAIEGHQRDIKTLRTDEAGLDKRRNNLREEVAKLERTGADPNAPELLRAKAELQQVEKNIESARNRRETLEKDIKRREEENKVLQQDVKVIDEMRAEGQDAIDRAVRLTNMMIERLPENVRTAFGGYEVTMEGAILLKEPSGELHRLLAQPGQPALAAGVTVQLSDLQGALDRMPR